MKIVIAEMLYPTGHLALNKRYVQIISQIGEVKIVDDGNYFSSMELEGVDILKVKRSIPNVQSFLKIKKFIPFLKFDPIEFLAHFINLLRIAIKIRKIDYDKILFMSARNDSLGLALPFFKKGSVAVFHHVDIDQILVRPHYIRSFKKYMNKYTHIVLADFIKEGLIAALGVQQDLVKVVYQPLINADYNNSTQRKRIVIGLGQGIDNEVLESIILLDKQNQSSLSYKLVLRDKKIEYKGNNLTVTKEYFSRDLYDYYLNSASLCLILYPKSFNLRYSGVLDDALSHGLPVLGNDIRVVRFFSQKYSSCCKVLTNIKDLYALPEDFFSLDTIDIKRFRDTHSDNNIKKMLIESLSIS